MTKERKCKHCDNILDKWQAPNAECCKDIKCIKNLSQIRNKKNREKIKAKS
jgi:hypothetical protein